MVRFYNVVNGSYGSRTNCTIAVFVFISLDSAFLFFFPHTVSSFQNWLDPSKELKKQIRSKCFNKNKLELYEMTNLNILFMS